MSKLVIGTTGPTIFNDEIKALVENYYKAIPLYIHQDTENGLKWAVDNIQALILAGGRDICPITYGQDITNHDNLSNFDIARDRRELFLIKECIAREIPILGICRGHQILAIANNLVPAFLKDINGSEICHSPSKAGIELDGLPCHKVTVLPQYKEEFFDVEFCNSFHHQAIWYGEVNKLPHPIFIDNGVQVLAYAYLQLGNKEKKRSAEQNVELMRGINAPWISCQWHPEEKPEDKINSIVLNKFRDMLPK